MNTAVGQPRSAPVKATWICLVIAWVLFLLPVPGAGLFVGWPLNLIAFILAIVVMTRGKVAGGLIPLLASLIASPIIYFIGLAIFGAAVSKGPYADYVEKARVAQEAAVAQAEASANAPAEAAEAAEAVEAPVALKVAANKLFADYEANEVAADNQYKGQLLEVSGTVAGISKDFTDKVYVEVATGNPFSSIHARGIADDVAAGLSKGAKITLVCQGSGLVMGSPILEDCQVQ